MDQIECACGCGLRRPIRDKQYKVRRYINGHQKIGKGRRATEIGIVFDSADAHLIEPYAWSISNGYPIRWVDGKLTPLHHILMAPPAGKEVDHINRNRLDCRRANLRIVSPQMNRQNQGLRRDNTTGFRGVYREGTRFLARVFTNGKYYRVGIYDTAEEAANMAVKARKKLLPGATD